MLHATSVLYLISWHITKILGKRQFNNEVSNKIEATSMMQIKGPWERTWSFYLPTCPDLGTSRNGVPRADPGPKGMFGLVLSSIWDLGAGRYGVWHSELLNWRLESWSIYCFLFVLGFYGPVNPMESCRARSVYLTTRLLGRFSPLSG